MIQMSGRDSGMTLEEQVLEFIKNNPKCYTLDIARALDIRLLEAAKIVEKLRAEGKVI